MYLLGQSLDLGGCLSLDIAGRRADHEGIDASVGLPCRCLLIERGEVFRLDGHRDSLYLAGLQQAGLGVVAQFLFGLIQLLAIGSSHEEFHHIATGTRTGVLDVDFNGIDAIGLADTQVLITKGGIAQTEAEGVGHGLAEGVEIAVAHVDVLLIVGVVDICLRITLLVIVLVAAPHEHSTKRLVVDIGGEVLVGIGITIVNLEGHRQLATGVHLATEHVGHAEARLLTTLPRADHSIDLILPRGQVDGTADIEQHNDLLALGMISLADSLDELLLAFLQIEVCLATVGSLTTLTTYRDDGHVAAFDGGIHFFNRELLFVSTCRRQQRKSRTAFRE